MVDPGGFPGEVGSTGQNPFELENTPIKASDKRICVHTIVENYADYITDHDVTLLRSTEYSHRHVLPFNKTASSENDSVEEYLSILPPPEPVSVPKTFWKKR